MYLTADRAVGDRARGWRWSRRGGGGDGAVATSIHRASQDLRRDYSSRRDADLSGAVRASPDGGGSKAEARSVARQGGASSGSDAGLSLSARRRSWMGALPSRPRAVRPPQGPDLDLEEGRGRRGGGRRLGPAGVWDEGSPQTPRECSNDPACCILQHLLRLLLEPLQCTSDLHFADAAVYAASAGDSLTRLKRFVSQRSSQSCN
jgi:hypothetical protein